MMYLVASNVGPWFTIRVLFLMRFVSERKLLGRRTPSKLQVLRPRLQPSHLLISHRSRESEAAHNEHDTNSQ